MTFREQDFVFLLLVLSLIIQAVNGDPVLSRTLNGRVTYHLFEETQDFDNSILACSEFQSNTTLARISNPSEFNFVQSLVSEVLDENLFANPVTGAQDQEIRFWIGKAIYLILLQIYEFLLKLFIYRSE